MPDAFDTVDPPQAAIYDLMIAGFSRYVISLLADRTAIDDKLGTGFGRRRAAARVGWSPRGQNLSAIETNVLQKILERGGSLDFVFVGRLSQGYRVPNQDAVWCEYVDNPLIAKRMQGARD